MTFREKLFDIRHKNNWTQQDLAKLTGLNQSIISNYERGKVPLLKNVRKIASSLNIDVDELLGLTDETEYVFDLIRFKERTKRLIDLKSPYLQHVDQYIAFIERLALLEEKFKDLTHDVVTTVVSRKSVMK